MSGNADGTNRLVGVVIGSHSMAISQSIVLACVPGLEVPEKVAAKVSDGDGVDLAAIDGGSAGGHRW